MMNLMMKLMGMFTCKQFVKIVAEDAKLGLWGRMQFRIHVFLCHKCRSYVKQMNKIVQSVVSIISKDTGDRTEMITRIEKRAIKENSKSEAS
jgi:hypothetical protein